MSWNQMKEAAALTLTTAASDSVLAIIQERAEQKMIHGYDGDHDEQHGLHELTQAAEAILAVDSGSYTNSMTVASELWPDNWDPAMLNHIVTTKDLLHRLAVAGALIVAEMDRIILSMDKALAELAKEPD